MHGLSLNIGYLPIGVDIGAGGAKLLQLRRRGGELALVASSRVELPALAGRADDAGRISTLAQAVAERIRSGGFTGSRCVIAVDDRWLRTRSVRQPQMPAADIDRAARLDAPGRLGFAEGEAAEIGWLRAGEVRQGDDIRDELIYVGSLRGPLEHLVYAMAEQGLRPMAIEPGFQASARWFTRTLRRAADQNSVRLIVDIGRLSTGVMLTRGRSVAFYKQLEIGGAAMTKAASDRLGLDPAMVEDLRRQRKLHDSGGEPVDPKVDRALFDAVRPLIGDLAHEVSLCLRYYSVTFRGAKPEVCLLVGGEGSEPRLPECFQEALHLPASVGRPFEGVRVEGAAGSGIRGPGCEWGVGAGLSLRVRDEAKSQQAVPGRRSADFSGSAPGPVATTRSADVAREAA